MFDLQTILQAITPLDKNAQVQAKARLDNLTKPIGSLGTLETMVIALCGITGDIIPDIRKKCIIIMCADNGVEREGVSSCPREVTATVTCNFTKGITGVNVLSRFVGADIQIIDIGVDADINHPQILNKKIAYGTNDIALGAAMTELQALEAIAVGFYAVENLVTQGVNVLGMGEMGIGNTTTSAAVIAALSGEAVLEVVGKGAGLTSQAFAHKIHIVEQALLVNQPDPSNALDVLQKLGGFDIAGLVGTCLGAAYFKKPIVLDGFIAGAAALVAIRLNPLVAHYLIASHTSAEPGTAVINRQLGITPPLMLEMRLGEGTGAAMGFFLIDAAMATYTQMGTFDDAKIEQYVPLD